MDVIRSGDVDGTLGLMLAASHRLYLCWEKTAMAWPHVGQ